MNEVSTLRAASRRHAGGGRAGTIVAAIAAAIILAMVVATGGTIPRSPSLALAVVPPVATAPTPSSHSVPELPPSLRELSTRDASEEHIQAF